MNKDSFQNEIKLFLNKEHIKNKWIVSTKKEVLTNFKHFYNDNNSNINSDNILIPSIINEYLQFKKYDVTRDTFKQETQISNLLFRIEIIDLINYKYHNENLSILENIINIFIKNNQKRNYDKFSQTDNELIHDIDNKIDKLENKFFENSKIYNINKYNNYINIQENITKNFKIEYDFLIKQEILKFKEIEESKITSEIHKKLKKEYDIQNEEIIKKYQIKDNELRLKEEKLLSYINNKIELFNINKDKRETDLKNLENKFNLKKEELEQYSKEKEEEVKLKEGDLNNIIMKYKLEINNLEKAKKDLKNEKSNLYCEHCNINKSKGILNTYLELEKQLKEKNIIIENHRINEKHIETEKISLKTEINNLNKVIQLLEKDTENYRNILNDNNKKISYLDNKITTLSNDNNLINNINKENEDEIRIIKNLNIDIKKDKKQLENDYFKLKKDLNDKIMVLESENNKFKSQLDDNINKKDTKEDIFKKLKNKSYNIDTNNKFYDILNELKNINK